MRRNIDANSRLIFTIKLDPVPPETQFGLMAMISDELYQDGYLKGFRSINDTFLIALDGTDFFSSEKISCPCCTQSTLKNGQALNRHIAVTPVLVSPDQKNVVALVPQFVQPQDGHDKQDYELAASGRWLDQWSEPVRNDDPAGLPRAYNARLD